jgi:hypothetical protein
MGVCAKGVPGTTLKNGRFPIIARPAQRAAMWKSIDFITRVMAYYWPWYSVSYANNAFVQSRWWS